jgi:hypothetical protein
VRARRCRRAGVLLALALVGTVASACSPYSGTTTQKVQQWASNSAFIADSNTLLSDISRVRRAVSIGTPKELRTICAGLAYDVGTTYETLPTPDLRRDPVPGLQHVRGFVVGHLAGDQAGRRSARRGRARAEARAVAPREFRSALASPAVSASPDGSSKAQSASRLP